MAHTPLLLYNSWIETNKQGRETVLLWDLLEGSTANEKTHSSGRLSHPHSREFKHQGRQSHLWQWLGCTHGQEGPGSEKCHPPDTCSESQCSDSRCSFLPHLQEEGVARGGPEGTSTMSTMAQSDCHMETETHSWLRQGRPLGLRLGQMCFWMLCNVYLSIKEHCPTMLPRLQLNFRA